MKKKWMQKAVAAALVASLLAGQALPAAAADAARVDTETLKIATLSDTHYLSPDMIKNTEDFTEHLNSDRKMFAESDAFLRALLDTVKQDDPDVLLISGDLTKDGEKEGHEALVNILETFEEETGAEVFPMRRVRRRDLPLFPLIPHATAQIIRNPVPTSMRPAEM